MPRYLLVLATAASLFAAPAITRNGIVHAASLAPPGLPNAALAQGALFSIFGSGLGPEAFATANAFPLQTTLAGVRITATQGATTVNAIPVFVFSSQINAILPSNTPEGLVAIRVVYNGETSRPETVEVVKSNFGTFAVNSAGFGPGVIQNFLAADNQPVNSLTQSAKPGGAIVLWGSGLGPVPSDTVAPAPGDLPGQIQVLVGGKPATKLYAGRAPCCSGLDQLVYTLPNDVPLGCYVPVQVVTGGSNSGNVTTMAISADGSPCQDAANPFNFNPLSSGRVGTVLLTHASYWTPTQNGPVEAIVDYGAATFRSYVGNQFMFEPRFALPPAGACTVYTASATGITDPALLRKLYPPFSTVDAGANVTITTQSRTVTLPREPIYPRDYSAPVGASAGGLGALIFSGQGAYTVAGPGGADIPAFTANVTTFPGINWTNRAQLARVDRSQPLNVTWQLTNPGSPGAAGYIAVVAGAATLTSDKATALFLCTAKAGDGQLTIPTSILRTLPASTGLPGTYAAQLLVGVLPITPAASFAAGNLTNGAAVLTSVVISKVAFQ